MSDSLINSERGASDIARDSSCTSFWGRTKKPVTRSGCFQRFGLEWFLNLMLLRIIGIKDSP